MKYAILVLAFKEPEMVNKLLQQLLHEFGSDGKIFIHVSRGSEPMIKELLVHPQIEVFPEHYGYDPKTREKNLIDLWGGSGLIKKMLYMFSFVCQSYKFDYCIVLSGQDLIVRRGIKQFFDNNSKKIFMDGGKDTPHQGARLLYRWPKAFKRKIMFKLHPLRIIRRGLLILYSTGINVNKKKSANLFDGMDLYKNLYWMALPAECVQYLVDYKDNNPDVMDAYYDSICPEESFFSTVLANHPRYYDMFNWIKGTERYEGVTYFGRFTTSFPMIEESDIEAIECSGCYLAKKFSINYNSSLVDYFYKKIMGEEI